MEINNSVLKQYLQNVYFITGTPCGGKSTVSRLLSKHYGLALYDVDAEFDRHADMSDPDEQPAMNTGFLNADEFFLRPVAEYRQWLRDNTREQLDFVLLDLIRLSADRKVVCDLHLSLEEAAALSDRSRVAFLLREPSHVMEEYCRRPDHEDFRQFIESATDAAAAKENCGRTLESLNRSYYETVKQSGFFWLERAENRLPEETAQLVARHLGLCE